MTERQVMEGWLEALLDYDPADCSPAWVGFLSFHQVSTAITLSLTSLDEVDLAIRQHQAEVEFYEASMMGR